ncbi:MAG TPA: hypothetical protein VFC59_00260 [Cryobacterium sp.]|nr:hypothetical protein [Cryobacterium sp.]
MPGKYIDAEQALSSLDRTPVVLRGFQGRDWELFASMPAKPVFDLMLLEAGGRSQHDLSRGEMLGMMSKMVPPEVFDAWLDGGATMDEATALLNRVIAAYNGEDGESSEGEASGPATGPTPTSSTSQQ